MGWSDFFYHGSTQDPDLGKFNYQTEQEKVKRQREIASMLLQQSRQGKQGQFIKNGDFIGYAGGNNLLSVAAQALTAYMGVKGMENADKSQTDLDARSLEALSYNLENKPWTKRAAEVLKAPDVQTVTPPKEEDLVQTFPVADSAPVEVRSLKISNTAERPWVPGIAHEPNKSAAQAVPIPPDAAQGAPQPSAPVVPQQAAQVVPPQAAQAMPPQAAQVVPPQAAQAMPPEAVQPVPPQAAQAMPQQAAQAMPPQAAQAMPEQPGPTAAEQIAYLQRIANSGPAGQLLAQQMMAKPQFQHVTVKNEDGSESVVQFDPSGRTDPRVVFAGTRSEGPSDKQLKRDEFAGKAYEKVVEAQGQFNEASQTYSKIQSTRELLKKYAPQGGFLSSARAAIGKFLGEDQVNQLDMSFRELAYTNLTTAFGSNPTEGERKAQMEVKASFERGTAPSLNALDTLLAGYERRMQLHRQQIEQWQAIYSQYRTQTQPQGGSAPMVDQLFPRR